MTETAHTTTGLERELLELPRQIQRAAADGDKERWGALRMRLDALPEYLRRRRAEPVVAEIERLEAERARLEETERRVREAELPEVPVHARGGLSPWQLRQQRIGQAVAAGAAVGAELKAARAALAEIEDEGSAG